MDAVSIFLAEVNAAGTGTQLDPYKKYAKQGYEVFLQCKYESEKLIWDKNVNSQWTVIASGKDTINNTKYSVSLNPNTKLYYGLHILLAQSVDEAIYRCIAGLREVYFIQLTLFERPMGLGFKNATTDSRLIGTEGNGLLIECITVGGNPAPMLSLTVLGTQVQTSVQDVRYFVANIPRIYHKTNVLCAANSDALDAPMTTVVQIHLNQQRKTFSELDYKITEKEVTKAIHALKNGKSTGLDCISNDMLKCMMPLVPVFNAPFVNALEMTPFSVSCTSTGSRPADRKYNLQRISCTANNTVGGFSNQISLYVRFAPDVSVSNVTYGTTDSIRTINCTADGYPDTYTFYKWQHRSVYGRIIRELVGDTILKLPVVPITSRYQDNGEYMCTVSNGIQAQPVITADNSERRIQYGEIGESVEIVVHVYSIPKFYYHTWFNNGKQIQLSTKFLISESSGEVEDVFHGKTVTVDGFILKLTINDIEYEDSINYTLLLGNCIGQSVEHTVVLKLSTPQKSETSSSGVIIGAVTGSLISLLIIILVLSFVIVRKRRGQQQCDNTVKFQNAGSDDQTNEYEEVQNNKVSKETRAHGAKSSTKHYDTLGLTDTPNTYDDLSNKGPEGKKNQSSTSNYEELGSKETPNDYDDLNNKVHIVIHEILILYLIASQETKAQSSTKHYDDLGAKDTPYVYEELNNEESQEKRDQSSISNYEVLGKKDGPNVYDDLSNEAREENKAQISKKYYEDLSLRNKPSVYDDIRNEETQDKVYENDTFQRD
ncbi:unnamed protein product [Mytilus coruscus]|uniref:Ig-like domain-containing protein n=1 Tax=Mytilus coruscus TaxID=42192 RepID=A0A6J8A2B9_MYTCO|nr:unnamed protein product [Mytilus coruscus]